MIANTAISVLLKFVQALLGFTTIHSLVRIWGLERYGTWVTFTSVAVYITMFDMGIGYGIRNRISQAWGQGSLDDAEDTVRIGAAFYALAALLGFFVAGIVMITTDPFRQHPVAVMLLWGSCVFSFFLSLHITILQALGRFRVVAMLSVVTPALWFAFVRGYGFLWPTRMLSIESAAAAYAVAILVQAAWLARASVRSHSFRMYRLAPIRLAEARPLLATGLKFFALQLVSLALMNSGNFLVYRHLGGVDTAQYDAANKVFSMFSIGFSVLVGIAWTEIAHARAAADSIRLARVFRGLHVVSLGMLLLALLCSAASAPITRLLTGVSVPFGRTWPFALMIGVQTLAYSSAVFLNAYERLRGQIVATMASLPIFFVVARELLEGDFGIGAIPAATAAAMLPPLLVCFFTARRLLADQRSHRPMRSLASTFGSRS